MQSRRCFSSSLVGRSAERTRAQSRCSEGHETSDSICGVIHSSEPSRPSGNQPRTATIDRDRGQTAQDFAVGIGVFLLAIAFVFAFLPSFVTPFESSAATNVQADRIASTILEESGTETPNQIDTDAFETTIGNATETELAEILGLRHTDRVNVSVYEIDTGASVDSIVVDADDQYDGQSASSVTRIVTSDDEHCTPACRLVVRVW